MAKKTWSTRPFRFIFAGVIRLLMLVLCGGSLYASEILPPGHRPKPPGLHALTDAKVVVRPGLVLEHATLIIRDGLIQAVGTNAPVPPGARVWPMTGLTIYPGFIDVYLSLSPTNRSVTTTEIEPILTSGINFFGVPGQEQDRGRPGPSHALTAVRSERRAAETYSPDAKTLEGMRELGFTAGNVIPSGGVFRGSSAFVLLSDSEPNDAVLKPDVFQHIVFDTQTGREDTYPRSLMGVIATVRQTFYDAQAYREGAGATNRALRVPFNPALEALLPVLRKQMPVVIEPGSALMNDRAARLAREFQLEYLLLASGEEWRRPDLSAGASAAFIVPLHFAAIPKLPEDDDWHQVSLDQLRAWDWAPENAALLRQQKREIALTTFALGDRKEFRKNLQLALDRGLSESDALAALTLVPANLCGLGTRLGTVEPGKIANLTIVEGPGYFDPEARVREVWIDGRRYPGAPRELPKTAGAIAKTDTPEGGDPQKAKPPGDAPPKPAAVASEKKEAKTGTRELMKTRVARSPLEGRTNWFTAEAILIEGATVWTCGPAGRLAQADLVIVGNQIKAVGQNLGSRPELAGKKLHKIDGRNRHVTPGLIDAHNHSLILGSVNEATIPSTAMVRIGDVINSETAELHRQLAGGLTVVNLLHGSANPIGGQNAIIKLRDGASPEGLKFDGAPPGIKFALGENVKQSNWGDQRATRFPQTRMGVRTFLANRFTAAREYLQQKEQHAAQKLNAPRHDLELEALGEILRGERWIHCHSYRQDEILVFLRLMEQFGVKVGTLQHVLEGYKIADEIAAHGAGASCFSDWWAYKFEVYDAIPYAGALMHQRGVVVSFNSDSSDLARRLYLEAAKAVKYGGLSETDALNLVTINPAKQLRIDQRVGSLVPGKDADFVVWSKSPLDSSTLCLETWIDGQRYFERADEEKLTRQLETERAALLDKAKKAGGAPDRSTDESAKDKFFQVSLEKQFEGIDRHCED